MNVQRQEENKEELKADEIERPNDEMMWNEWVKRISEF